MVVDTNIQIQYRSSGIAEHLGGDILITDPQADKVYYFKHLAPATVTRTVFRDEQGYELDRPCIYSPSAQAAIGAAVKIVVDRQLAALPH